MTVKAANNPPGDPLRGLSKERIHQLLAAVGSEPQEDTARQEATEHNWHEPPYFSRQELIKLDDLAKRIAAAAAGKFSGFCRSKFDVTIASISFYFAGELAKQASDSGCKEYCLPFGADPEHICGFVGIPEQTAVVWARQLLGDFESEKVSNKALSQLEESLLLDLTTALVDTVSDLHAGGANFRAAGSLLKNRWPLNVPDTQELCRISFDVKKTASENSSRACILIICEELSSAVGKTIQAHKGPSAEEISKTILNHLQGMPVTITAQLVSTELTFEEIATLDVDDILLLDKKVDQPLDLIIDGRTVCHGWPVRSAGKYAVMIASAAPGCGART